MCLLHLILPIVPSVTGWHRRGGDLDNQSGPVSKHQHHVHPLSESTCTSRTGTQHQVPDEHLILRGMLSLAGSCRRVAATDPTFALPVCDSLANGSAALIAVGNTSRSEFIKHLKRYNSSSGQVRPSH